MGTEDGKQETGGRRRREKGEGRRETGDGRREMGNGRQETGDGDRRRETDGKGEAGNGNQEAPKKKMKQEAAYIFSGSIKFGPYPWNKHYFLKKEPWPLLGLRNSTNP
jgi:hypothetical protein